MGPQSIVINSGYLLATMEMPGMFDFFRFCNNGHIVMPPWLWSEAEDVCEANTFLIRIKIHYLLIPGGGGNKFCSRCSVQRRNRNIT